MNRLATVSIFFLVIGVSVILTASGISAQERFIDNKDGTVTDTMLNVMWAKNDNLGDIDWRQAEKWVRYTFPYTLSVTYPNWRMPTLDELKTLYNSKASYKGYETDCGQNVKIFSIFELSCGWVWASEVKFISARLFNFHRGYSYTDRVSKYKAYRVLAVRNLD